MLDDEQRLDTIKIRVESMRQFLESGAPLFAMYTEHGLATRSKEQLKVFNELPYDNLHFFCLSKIEGKLDNQFSGATYYYRDLKGISYIFSVHSFQANAPTDGLWTLWSGSHDEDQTKERCNELNRFFFENLFFTNLILN